MLAAFRNPSMGAERGVLGRSALLSQRRWLLLGGSGLCLALPLVLFAPAAHWVHDPELFLLLRGMGVLKLALALVALGVVAWRLGQPMVPRLQALAMAGVWGMSLAAGLIWQLTLVLPASGLFHAATIALLLAAWRDMEAEPAMS